MPFENIDTNAYWQDRLEQYINYVNKQDLAGAMSMQHSLSPTREVSRQVLMQLFKSMYLHHELVLVKLVGSAENFIVVNMQQKIRGIEVAPGFKDTLRNSLIVFCMEDSVWKIWSMMPLEVTEL